MVKFQYHSVQSNVKYANPYLFFMYVQIYCTFLVSKCFNSSVLHCAKEEKEKEKMFQDNKVTIARFLR